MKKEVVVFALFLVLSVEAVQVSVTPQVLYESVATKMVIEVDNRGGSTVHEVTIATLLPIVGTVSYEGWLGRVENGKIVWGEGSIEPNVKSAIFEFEVLAPDAKEDAILGGVVSFDGVPVANYSVRLLADQTEEVLASVKSVNVVKKKSAAERVSVPVPTENYVVEKAGVIGPVERPAPVPEDNGGYAPLPPLEPRLGMELSTGLFAESIEKFKGTKWLLAVFALLVGGIYWYEQHANRWVEWGEFERKKKN